jgi:hypothetical protein
MDERATEATLRLPRVTDPGPAPEPGYGRLSPDARVWNPQTWVAEHIDLGPERRVTCWYETHSHMIRWRLERLGVAFRDKPDQRGAFELNECEPAKESGWTAREIVQKVRHLMHRQALHEEDEWLRVDGVLVFDPHKGEYP